MIRIGKSYRYSGCIHLHTTHSDGTKPLAQIISIAQREKLDFLMVTDHMTLAAKDEGLEGWHENLLVGVGYEHNDPADTHHYLIFGADRVYPPSLTAKEYVAATARDQVLGIIAHPDEVRTRKKYPPYPWKDWSVEGFTGIEIWNQMSEWTERLTPVNIFPSGLHQPWSLRRPPKRTLDRWDEIAQTRPCVGIGGADAHSFKVMIGPITLHVFPYRRHFRALRTVVHLLEPLSPDNETALAQLYAAISARRVWFGNCLQGAFEEAEITLTNGKVIINAGESLTLSADCALQVALPRTATIRVIHNGRELHSESASTLRLPITREGIYRTECWRGNRAWFFTNHFRVLQ